MGVWCGKDAALRLLWGDGGVKNGGNEGKLGQMGVGKDGGVPV